MKTRSNKSLLWLLSLLLMAATSITLTACSDDDDNNGDNNGQQPTEDVATYDDLAVLQTALCNIDSAGQLVRYEIGQALYESEPQHLYIGVDDATEAEEYFRAWIAPDVELAAATPTTTDLTAQLTDTLGRAQGTVYFRLGSGSTVAEVTFSAETQIKYVDKVTFLLNSAWPFNSGEAIWHLGDIHAFTPTGKCGDGLEDNDRTLNFVCIREGGNGVKPLWAAITNSSNYKCGNGDVVWKEVKNYVKIRTSDYCPGEGNAKTISNILQKNWDYFVSRFDAAGDGKLIKDKFYWYDHDHWNWYRFYDLMQYSSGYTYGTENNTAPFLLKIDWLNDGAISLTPTAGTDHGNGEGYANLFDDNTGTKWCVWNAVKTADRIDGGGKCWFVEFENYEPVQVKGYYLSTANDTKKYHERNPRYWKLYGKKTSRGQWKLLDDVDVFVTGGGLPADNYKTNLYWLKDDAVGEYQYFRLEIHGSGGVWMQLSRFGLNP